MITFVGDVFPKSPVRLPMVLDGTLVVNLEAPLTVHETGFPGKINLRGSATAFAKTFAGKDVVVTLANNHCMDFMRQGLLDTRDALDELGFPYGGAGDAADRWQNPIWLDVGVRVAILAYADASTTPVYEEAAGMGAAPLSLERATADIAAAKAAGAERVAISVHWGEEQVHLPTLRCVKLGRALVDAGADVVVGHHAHCIQSYETYSGKPIMYGLGNFIFPTHSGPSYYDVEGRPTRHTDIRTSRRNCRSLALHWDPITGRFQIQPLRFTGNAVVAGGFRVGRYRLNKTDEASYESRYARAYTWGKLQHALAGYLSRPKLPRLLHLRNVSRLLRVETSP